MTTVLLTDDATLAATVTWEPGVHGVYLHISGLDVKSIGQLLTPHTAMLLGQALIGKAQTAYMLRDMKENGIVTDRED